MDLLVVPDIRHRRLDRPKLTNGNPIQTLCGKAILKVILIVRPYSFSH